MTLKERVLSTAHRSALAHLHTHTTQWWQFFRPDLDVAVVSRHSRFTLDLSEETLQAASTFHVLLAAGNDNMVASSGGGGIDAVRVRVRFAA